MHRPNLARVWPNVGHSWAAERELPRNIGHPGALVEQLSVCLCRNFICVDHGASMSPHAWRRLARAHTHGFWPKRLERASAGAGPRRTCRAARTCADGWCALWTRRVARSAATRGVLGWGEALGDQLREFLEGVDGGAPGVWRTGTEQPSRPKGGAHLAHHASSVAVMCVSGSASV